MDQEIIELPNGYKLSMKREYISHVGRSIWRSFDHRQVVLEILDERGKVTKRLGIPGSIEIDVREFLHG